MNQTSRFPFAAILSIPLAAFIFHANARAADAPPTGAPASATTDAHPWERRFVARENVNLEIFVAGTGPTVLMHPSVGRPATDYKDLGDRLLAAGYRIVAINPRGVGSSTGPLKDLTLHDMAADVWAVADSLHADRVHLLGHIFGNRVMRTASADKPDRVLSITLLGAGGEIEAEPEVKKSLSSCFDTKLPEAEHMDAVRKTFFSPGNDPSTWKDGWFADAADAQGKATKATPLKEWYAGGTARMLIVQGIDDKVARPENAWNLVNRRPESRLVVLPHCGHAMLPEQPVAIAGAVIDFLGVQASGK